MRRFLASSVQLGLALGIACLVATPTLAISDVTLRLDPLQPLPGENFVVIVEGMADGDVQLDDVNILAEDFGNGKEIRVTLREDCAAACTSGPFRIDLPVDASSADLAQDDHAISIHHLEGPGQETLLLFKRFVVADVFYNHFLQPQAYLVPEMPTDNELVRLVATSVGDYCGPTTAVLDRLERVGNVIHVFLTYWAGFSGGFPATSGARTQKCSPPGVYSDAILADLGILDAGTYRVDVYLEELGDFGTLPIRTERIDLAVSDAPDRVALQDGRFEVSIDWRDFENLTGVGKPVPGASNDSTLFSFFGDDNWEVLVKVLDACTLNGKFWVLTAAATTVEYEINITDTVTGEDWTYDNPLGFPSPAVTDVEAFDCSP